jgi:hypothetical protein
MRACHHPTPHTLLTSRCPSIDEVSIAEQAISRSFEGGPNACEEELELREFVAEDASEEREAVWLDGLEEALSSSQ